MIFEENKKNISMYQTPFGRMDMGIATHQNCTDRAAGTHCSGG